MTLTTLSTSTACCSLANKIAKCQPQASLSMHEYYPHQKVPIPMGNPPPIHGFGTAWVHTPKRFPSRTVVLATVFTIQATLKMSMMMMMMITKRYLDRFIRFCRTHGIVQQTNTQKDTHTQRPRYVWHHKPHLRSACTRWGLTLFSIENLHGGPKSEATNSCW